MYIKDTKIVLDLHFAPSLYWFTLFINNELDVYIEAQGSFKKSCYMNRCEIAGVNGLINISLPVLGGRAQKVPYRETMIDWSSKHSSENIHSVLSAYNNAPYFEYYWDELLLILQSKENSLWKLNLKVLEFLMKEIGIKKELKFTEKFERSAIESIDFRKVLKPVNREDLWPENAKKYTQVFFEKNPFLAGLSVLDLLFNLGPESEAWLKEFSSCFVKLK